MEKSKWIVRGASLAIILGFFLPAALVSCSGGYVDGGQSLSLANVAGQLSKPMLYLLPVGFLVVLGLTALRPISQKEESNYLWGQLAAGGIGVLITVVTVITLVNQFQQGSFGLFEVKPAFGFFVILAGIIAFAVGWAQQYQLMGQSPGVQPPGVPAVEPSYDHPALPQSYAPVLSVVSGSLPFRRVEIPYDNFTIGRSRTNALQLPDDTVSRQHARIRLAQGMVFLQDQDSSGGTFVNGHQINSIRLNNGDEIQIGPYKFRMEG